MMALAILDPTQKRSPTCLSVTVSGAWENSPIDFFIDLEDPLRLVYTADANDDGEIEVVSIPVPSTIGPGTHTVIARSVSIGDADADEVTSATFTLQYSPAVGHVVGFDADPVDVPGAVNLDGSRNWVLQDLMPGGLGSYIFLRNPRTQTVPVRSRELTARHTTAINGRHHITQSSDTTTDMEFTGVAFTEGEHRNLANYFDLNRRIYLIDHENRAWVVAFGQADIKHRLRTRYSLPGGSVQMSDWVAEYTVTAHVYGSFRTPVSSIPPLPSGLPVPVGGAAGGYAYAGLSLGAQPFTPASIAQLDAWIDASQITATEGQVITSLTERSLNHRTFTAPGGAGPVFRTAVDGHPRLDFTGGGSTLVCSGYNPGTAGITFIAVSRKGTTGSNPALWTYNVSGHAYELRYVAASGFLQVVGDIANGGPAFAASQMQDPYVDYLSWMEVLVGTAPDNYSRLYVNGVQWGAGGTAPTMPNVAANLRLGSSDSGEMFVGLIAEAMVFRGALSDDDLLAVTTYLMSKYAL